MGLVRTPNIGFRKETCAGEGVGQRGYPLAVFSFRKDCGISLFAATLTCTTSLF